VNSFSVAFRVDASVNMGTGHVIRCLTLADALREQGAKCEFVCRELEGNLMDYISSRGYEVHALPKPHGNLPFGFHLTHASWLGVDWLTDAQQTCQVFKGSKVDLFVVDHYALDHMWESIIRSVCHRILVIDDLADRSHNCDLLLNQNYGSSLELYAGLFKGSCTQLIGPEYALLKPAYAQCRVVQRIHSGTIDRAFIYFGGGSDPMDVSGMALRAFLTPELRKIELDIVIGSNYAHKERLEYVAACRSRANIHTMLPDLSELMVKADIAVGAGGATTWERCCLGLPSIVVSMADNQRSASEALALDGLIRYVGHIGDVTHEMICEQITRLIGEPKKLRDLAEKSMKLVDGNGCSKVIDVIICQCANAINSH
jgi:UDP-2,4-diacetamido-2,4,6-trideoxy-beta-L-altropyranose hydrolase